MLFPSNDFIVMTFRYQSMGGKQSIIPRYLVSLNDSCKLHAQVKRMQCMDPKLYACRVQTDELFFNSSQLVDLIQAGGSLEEQNG